MLTRSVHNNDLKGLGSLRNLESSLSELNIAINLNLVNAPQDNLNFLSGYNLGKEAISKSDRELVFQTEVSDKMTLDRLFMNDIFPLEEELIDSREVDFMRASYNIVGDKQCIDLTLRNSMSYPIEVNFAGA
jgi:hypothetical protein